MVHESSEFKASLDALDANMDVVIFRIENCRTNRRSSHHARKRDWWHNDRLHDAFAFRMAPHSSIQKLPAFLPDQPF
jgi:hypothetical protein